MATYAAYRHIELDNIGYGKKRVLKPPGGGSSDIFGGAPEETSPRRIKNHNHSQLGSTMFGENSTNGSDTPRAKPDGNPVTGTGYTGDSENNSAPVQNGNGNVSEKVNGSTTGSVSPPAPAAQPRTRVPPGGFSSGLW